MPPKTRHTILTAAYVQVRQTFDHLLVLGGWDIHYNYSHLVPE
jgi:hypothetical protein